MARSQKNKAIKLKKNEKNWRRNSGGATGGNDMNEASGCINRRPWTTLQLLAGARAVSA